LNYKNLTYKKLQEWFEGANFKTKPFKHQLASMAFAIGESLNRVMFFHGIGTGKTLVALYLQNLWNVNGRTLVICPNTVIKTWKDQIEEHTDYTYVILKGSRQDRWNALTTKHADIWIINYEGLQCIGSDIKNTKNRKGKPVRKHTLNSAYAKSLGFECVIADECHKLKDSFSLQAKIAGSFSKYARYSILMTGTPISRSLSDIFGEYLVLDLGKTFGACFVNFRDYYFYENPKKMYDWLPKRICSHCSALYSNKIEHLKTHNMTFEQYHKKYLNKEMTSEDLILAAILNTSLRYSRDECVGLPERVYEIKEVGLTEEQTFVMRKIILGLNIDKLNEITIPYHTQKMVQITSGFILKEGVVVYEFTPNPKLIELEEILEQVEGKFIIYHQYIHEYKMISTLLKKMRIKHELINGSVKNKEERIDAFIKNNDCKGLIAHPRSGGEGLNLQVANTSIFYSNGYIGNILREQAEGRTHRTGQKNVCVYIDIVMKDTIDYILYMSLKHNTSYVKGILDYIKNYK